MEQDARPTHLDLFSGIGGFALAAQWAGFRTIGFCEIDKYCQKVLAKNFMPDRSCNDGIGNCTEQEESMLSGIRSPRIHGNIFDLDGTQFRGVTIITGGFPCQPFSVAGKRRGAADDRAIWPEMFRVIREARPAWVLGENVPGIIPMELDNVLSDLEGIGYATRSFVIPACAVDARHRRDRLWIIGRNIRNDSDSNSSNGSTELGKQQGELAAQSDRICQRILPDTAIEELEGKQWSELQRRGNGFTDCCIWSDESEWFPQSPICRVAHGIPSRLDRLKGLGNAIVPQVACEILREIRNLID